MRTIMEASGDKVAAAKAVTIPLPPLDEADIRKVSALQTIVILCYHASPALGAWCLN